MSASLSASGDELAGVGPALSTFQERGDAEQVFQGRGLLAIVLYSLTACSAGEDALLVSGQRFSWSELKGQWVVVNFWAEWCEPCHEEIPELNALDREPRVRVLGVNYDGLAGAELDSLLKRMGIRFSALLATIESGVE